MPTDRSRRAIDRDENAPFLKRQHQLIVERPRLQRRIADASAYPVIRFLAPAGFGKSVAIRQLLESAYCPIYIAVPKSASNLRQFIRVFATGCSKQIKSMGSPPDENIANPHSEQTVDIFIAWAHANLLGTHCTVIIDDIHNCDQDSQVAEFITRLVDLLKDKLRFILSSRTLGHLPHARWHAYGDSDDPINADDLRMSLDEALALASQLASPATIVQITKWVSQTRGFPVPLSYAIRASVKKIDEVEIISASRSVAFQFLAEHLWQSLIDSDRILLEIAALLPPLHTHKYERAGIRRASQRLAALAEEISFLTLTRDSVLSMHDLFRDFVRHQLTLDGLLASRERLANAVSVLFISGHMVEAYDTLLDSGEADAVLEAVERYAVPEDLALRARLIPLIEALPVSDRSLPALALCAEYSVRILDPKGMRSANEILVRSAASSDQLLSAIRAITCFTILQSNLENEQWRDRIEIIVKRLDKKDQAQALAAQATCLARCPNSSAEAYKLIQEARQSLVQLDDTTRLAVQISLSVALFFLGNSRLAAQLSEHAAALALKCNNTRGHVQALNVFACMLYDLEDPYFMKISDQLRNLVSLNGMWTLAQASHQLPAEYYARKGEIVRARSAIALQKLVVHQTLDIDNANYFRRLCLALCDIAEGNFDAIISNYQRVESVAHPGAEYHNAVVLAIARSFTHDLEGATSALATAHISRDHAAMSWEKRFIVDFFPLELVALCAVDKWHSARAILIGNSDIINDRHPLFQSLIKLISGPPFVGLNQSLEICYGKPFIGLSALLIKSVADRKIAAVTSGLPGLTLTEKAVLNLLSLGKSNKEIALARARSTETVKRQLAALYRKLGVENRTSAIAVAQEHGLIP